MQRGRNRDEQTDYKYFLMMMKWFFQRNIHSFIARFAAKKKFKQKWLMKSSGKCRNRIS